MGAFLWIPCSILLRISPSLLFLLSSWQSRQQLAVPVLVHGIYQQIEPIHSPGQSTTTEGVLAAMDCKWIHSMGRASARKLWHVPFTSWHHWISPCLCRSGLHGQSSTWCVDLEGLILKLYLNVNYIDSWRWFIFWCFIRNNSCSQMSATSSCYVETWYWHCFLHTLSQMAQFSFKQRFHHLLGDAPLCPNITPHVSTKYATKSVTASNPNLSRQITTSKLSSTFQPNSKFRNGFKTSSHTSSAEMAGLSCHIRSENCANTSVPVSSEIVVGMAMAILCSSCTNADLVVVGVVSISPIPSWLDDAKGISMHGSCCTGCALTVLGTAVARSHIKLSSEPSFIFLLSFSLLACASLQVFVPRWFFMIFLTPAVPQFFFTPQSRQVTYPSLSTWTAGVGTYKSLFLWVIWYS